MSLLLVRLLLGSSLALLLQAGSLDPSDFKRVAVAVRQMAGPESDLRVLCDSIGPRMVGTAGMRHALEWAETTFGEAGLSRVRLEAVPVPLRWREGATHVKVLEPSAYTVRAAASALSPAIETTLEADVADGGSGREGFIRRSASEFRDRVLLVSLDEADSFETIAATQRDAMVALREATEVGAKAVLFVSNRSNRLLYRHINSFSGELDEIPSLLVAREDGLRMLRALRDGATVRARITMPNQIGAPFETANVIGEIPGTDLPQEIVVLAAHLDSWDLGTGCLDNGVNVVLVTAVARSIMTSRFRPRRTLRFVLFGGEELGLLGSRAYVDRHRTELDRHVAVIVHDMGNGPLLGYSVGGREEVLPTLASLLAPLLGPDHLAHTVDPYFISDNFTFVLRGVPALFGIQDTSAFFLPYHTEADTYDKVSLENIRDTAVAAAATLLGISEREPRIAERLSEPDVTAWMRSAGVERYLRFLGVWDLWRPRSGYNVPDSP